MTVGNDVAEGHSGDRSPPGDPVHHAPAAPPALRASVILIREWEQQMSSNGCCGRLEGDFLQRGEERCFPERRQEMEAAGELYRAVRERHGNRVQLRIVDPRNAISLLPMLLRDFLRFRVGPGAALATLFGFSVSSVVVNGRLVTRGAWPSAEHLLRQLESAT